MCVCVCVCVCVRVRVRVCVCVFGGDWMVNVHEEMLVCICMYVSVHLWAITAVLCCQQRERDSEGDCERGESEREGERDDSQRCLWVPNSLRDSVTKYYLYCCRGALGTLRGWRKMTWGEDKQKESRSPLCGSLSPPGQMRSWDCGELNIPFKAVCNETDSLLELCALLRDTLGHRM